MPWWRKRMQRNGLILPHLAFGDEKVFEINEPEFSPAAFDPGSHL